MCVGVIISAIEKALTEKDKFNGTEVYKLIDKLSNTSPTSANF